MSVLSPSDIDDYLLDEDELVLDVEEGEGEGEDEEEDETETETEDEEYVAVVRTNARVSPNTRLNPARRIVFEEEEEEERPQVPLPQTSSNSVELIQVDDRSIREQGEATTPSSSKRIQSEIEGLSSRGELNGNETDGVSCPICMESWSSEGSHQVCCLPCGHVYGFSCIDKWIRQCRRNSAKCPQCSRKCGVKDIIKLYVSRVAVVDGEQEKKLRSLHTENEFLKLKIASLHERICQDKEEKMCKEASRLENISSGEMRRRTSEFISSAGDSQGQAPLSGRISTYGGQASSCCNFELEDELVVDGARLFDMDASNRILILARRLPGMGGHHVLTKISLMYPYDSENIQLPLITKAVKDLRVSPCAGKLVLFASLGKNLSILSMESNNIVLTYDLPGPAWSCSWDLNSPNHLYAGLQNGTLLVFDMRQTARPMESISGMSCYPIHTLHSLVHKTSTPCDGGTVLSASSIGPCVWNTGGVGERPFLVPEIENQGVCISLAYCPSTDDIVASFRPKVKMAYDVVQPSLSLSPSPSPTVLGRGTLGSHVLIKRVRGNCYNKLASSYANVNDVRMLKSAIVNIENCNPLFACGDELTRGLSLCELPSLRVMRTLEPHQHPILDVKFSASLGSGILGCISENKLQLYSAKLS